MEEGMRTLWIALVIAFAVAACDHPADAIRNLHYYKDSRSNVCFASGFFHTANTLSVAFSYVPCNLIPENLLETVSPQ